MEQALERIFPGESEFTDAEVDQYFSERIPLSDVMEAQNSQRFRIWEDVSL